MATTTTTSSEPTAPSRHPPTTLLSRLLWVPPWLRWDPSAPASSHELSWPLVCAYGATSAFTVANLYYSHPILHVLSLSFSVPDERAALVPTVTQAGYAAGLLLVTPAADILPRRHMALALLLACAAAWLGLALSTTFEAFLGLSFVVGGLTGTAQLMFPLAAQFAPPRHRATMISIVMSGLVFGILVARLISGIIAEFADWRVVYWLALGLQLLVFLLLFLMMPDYPVLRPGTSYPRTVLSIVTLPVRHPVLVQQSLLAFLVMGVYVSFWTTLTFQLALVFDLSTLVIGLFALIGISPVLLNPVVSRLLTSRIHPTGTLLISVAFGLAATFIGTFVGTFSLAGPVIMAFLGDLAINTFIVANRMAIAGVDPKKQNAVNAVYMIFTFCGQLFGTAVGNTLYAQGGWLHSGALGIGLMGGTLLIIAVRGPHETRWVGWRGGWDLSKPIGAKQPPVPKEPKADDVEASGAVRQPAQEEKTEKEQEPVAEKQTASAELPEEEK